MLSGEVCSLAAEITVTVRNPHGLHARPAAAFVQAAAGFKAAITVRNLSANRGPAPAKSILALLSLGVRAGDEVGLSATGEDAEAAVAALAALLDAEPAG
jgi:phosphotransferase system HPr (HPr) family protein